MLYKTTAVLGLIFGDEAKAKLVDILLPENDIIVRFQGGPNAGHTVYHEGNKLVFHSVPSGATNKNCKLVIAGACVIDPIQLIQEIEHIESFGFSIKDRLFIYSNAIIITQYEKTMDALNEEILSKSGSQIGTTKRGIGPAYSHHADRIGIVFEDLFDANLLRKKIDVLASKVNVILKAYGKEKIDPDMVCNELLQFSELKRHLVYTTYLYEQISEGKRVLFEGAQGALLCPINGSYPYVTSFPTGTGAIAISCNIPISMISRVIGVVKAYPTRVGEGPFPTKIHGPAEDDLRKKGNEFGATTGRPRDCGWPDLPLLKYVCMVLGITELMISCIDTLCKMEDISICEEYEVDGEILSYPKSVSAQYLSRVSPILKPFYIGVIDNLLSFCDGGYYDVNLLPETVAEFISKVSRVTGVRVKMIGVGLNSTDVINLI